MAGCRLYTGITGLLGQYLLYEALRRREEVCVIVRGRRGISAAERVDQLISIWERRQGTVLQRPVVLDGDLREEGLGLSGMVCGWFRRNVTSVVHSAASVLFQESPSGEPTKTNVDGTRHLLNVCRKSSVREFHYVSSAYACGLVDRSKPVFEELHSQNGPFGNIYERSKCLAEHFVVQAEGDFTKTVYRPSVIVGESESGYSPSFNAIYTPLRLAWLMLREAPLHFPPEDELLGQIGLRGTEARNLVPVNWVAEAIGSIVRQPSCHGGIYHITNPIPTEGREIFAAMVQSLSSDISLESGSDAVSGTSERITLAGFHQHMESYRSYFQPDPIFDNSRFQAARICPPCPSVNKATLTRAFDFAVRSQFENAEKTADAFFTAEPRKSLDGLIRRSNDSIQTPPLRGEGIAHHQLNHATTARIGGIAGPHDVTNEMSLTLSGPGGGCWKISIDSGAVLCDLPDFSGEEIPRIYSSAAAFRRWLQGDTSLEDALQTGMCVLVGMNEDLNYVSFILSRLRSSLTGTNDRNCDALMFDRLQVIEDVMAAGTQSC